MATGTAGSYVLVDSELSTKQVVLEFWLAVAWTRNLEMECRPVHAMVSFAATIATCVDNTRHLSTALLAWLFKVADTERPMFLSVAENLVFEVLREST
jgi:hypothetical protein